MSTVWWWAYGHGRRLCSERIDSQTDEVYIDAVSGLGAGLLSTLAAHPLDSVCSRIMTGATKSVGIIGATREIAAAEGFAVLWRGLAPSMAGTVVSSSIFALAYEFIKRASKLKDQD
jgi:solute carrier family 25 folate transporter 32